MMKITTIAGIAAAAILVSGKEYEDYFSQKLMEYSNGALDVKWTEKAGYSLMV